MKIIRYTFCLSIIFLCACQSKKISQASVFTKEVKGLVIKGVYKQKDDNYTITGSLGWKNTRSIHLKLIEYIYIYDNKKCIHTESVITPSKFVQGKTKTIPLKFSFKGKKDFSEYKIFIGRLEFKDRND